jgi:hypothetical protein
MGVTATFADGAIIFDQSTTKPAGVCTTEAELIATN